MCCQTTYQTNVMNNFFRANSTQKEFNLLQMEQVDSWLHPSLVYKWAFSRASVLTHQSTCGKSNQLTNLQTHSGLEGILSNYMYLSVQEEGFPVELLFYCLLFAKLLLWILTCLTWAQPSHTYKNWTNHETSTAYQKWSHISLWWLWWISERAFVH